MLIETSSALITLRSGAFLPGPRAESPPLLKERKGGKIKKQKGWKKLPTAEKREE